MEATQTVRDPGGAEAETRSAVATIARRAPASLTVLAIASLGVFMAFVDATIVNIAFPNIERSFRSVSVGSLSWVLNAYNIVFAAFLVSAGRIGDLLGRRRIFLLGLALFTVASALCAIAPSAAALIGFRVLQAIGAAMVVPAALALVLASFPPERHAHAVALFSAVGALAAGVGPSLGGLLVTAADWRLVFLVNVPIGIAAILLSRRELVESRAPGRRRMPDLVGALVFAGAIAALVLGVVQGQSWGWTSPRILAAFMVAAGLGILFVRRCTWHRSPLVDLGLLRIRTFSAANAMTVLAAAGFYGYTLCNVLFLTAVWHYSILDAGLAITPGPFVAAAVAGPTSRLAERYGHRPVLVLGGLIWGGAVMWFVARTGIRPNYPGVWLPGMILLGIGAGSLFPNLGGAAVASTPGEGFATATSLNSVARQVGAAIGVAVVIAIIGTPSPSGALAAFHHAWEFGAAMLLAAGLGCMAVGRVGAGEDASATPSLSAAARAVLGPRPAEQPLTLNVPDLRPSAAPVIRSGGPPESTADFLGGVSIFAGLPRPLLEKLAETTRPVRLAAGAWLFHEGDAGDAMYIVRAGRVEVVNEAENAAVLRVLGRGDVVGELALLSGAPRAASVRALRPSDLIAIHSDEFERVLLERPEVSLGLAKALAGQLRETRAPLSPIRPLSVAIALVGLDKQVPIARLGAMLAAGIGRYASVTTLTGGEAPAPGNGTSAAAVYAPLLDRCASGHDHVVMIAGRPWEEDPWTNFCLQQADRILAVASGADSAALAGQRLELRGCDLVAWNVAPGSGGISDWATALDPVETHAWRSGPGLERDLLRSARRLTGRSVGIVLSGGGARAFSHIGVLEELVGAGITIDRVAGASMGAYIGAMFAMGLSPDEIDARCYEEWVRRRPLSDYSFPRHALIRGQRGIALVERSVGSVAIEELPVSFSCHATDLRSGEAVLSRSGPLREALQRTMCIPIIAPPRVRGERLLVDGALVDNLPIEHMAALGEGPIIAADVKASLSSTADQRPTSEPSAERSPERLPTLGETVMRVVFMGAANTSQAARRHSSLLITAHPPGIGLLEFHQIDHAREAGRQAARAALATPAAAKLV